MDKSYLKELLQRYLNGKATQEEVDFINAYYDLFQDDPDIIGLMTEEERAGLLKQSRNTLWQTIERRQHPGGAMRLFSLRAISAAAAVVLIFFSVRFFSVSPSTVPVAERVAVPGVNRESHVIVLPDGTSVILDSGGKLNYPSSFDGKTTREVFLTGQAFFNVKHITAKPFIVHAGALSVTVLGTAFDVRALPAENEITVTVKRGKVKIAHLDKVLGVIMPRQQIIYNIVAARATQKTVTDDNLFHWKDGDLVLDNLTMSEAARILEDRFRVTISVEDPRNRSERFTAIFPRTENLEQALKSICAFNGATYSYNDAGKLLIRFP